MKKSLIMAIAVLVIIVSSCTPPEPKDKCNTLTGQTTIDNCYFEKAISTADITLCEKIEMKVLREACISEIGIALNDQKICEGLDETAKGSCHAKIAINNNNESMCKPIESDYWWNICHYEIGLAKNDEGICFEVYDSNKADECFAKIAEAKQDEWSCSWILEPIEGYHCYRKLALIKENVSICNLIDNSVWRNGNCIKKFAEETNNVSICELITIHKIKQDCLNKFTS